MIVVGNPHLVRADTSSHAAGRSAAIARAARGAGADVQLVGKVGEDPAGDAVLLDLANAGIGHVAVLRDASVATPTTTAVPDETRVDDADPFPDSSTATGSAALDGGDIELALRYLTDYRVIVLADELDDAAVGAVLDAAKWNSAAIVVVLRQGNRPPPDLPPEATVLEAPPDDRDDTFAALVGRYAAALDRGVDPASAFAAVTTDTGWTPATVDEG